jgi:hypothetical protein
MNLEPIAAMLADNDCGLMGKTLFINEAPANFNQGVLLLDGYHGTAVDQYMPNYYPAEFRVIVRSVDFRAGEALAMKAFKQLSMAGGFVHAEMIVNRMWPLNLPRSYRRSVGAYWEFEMDVEVTFVDTRT